ncbi:hypothetical protein, partial [Pseudomonas edaphica]|uniref:hypothetical protein n=1 Tax=Pseudomonas edaphica TaxID=2006980 RepID=UPI00197F942E
YTPLSQASQLPQLTIVALTKRNSSRQLRAHKLVIASRNNSHNKPHDFVINLLLAALITNSFLTPTKKPYN